MSQGSIDHALEHQLSDIVVPSGSNISGRTSLSRGTPRSARFGQDGMTPGLRKGEQQQQKQDQSTPLAVSASGYHPETPTPPFSPRPQKAYSVEPSPSIAPKALPTPPPQHRSGSRTRPGSSPDVHPQSPRLVMKQIVASQTADEFCQATIERFRSFAHQETVASSDAERVRLFAEFIVSESRLRRERYSQAIGVMGSEIFDLTRDLFRPMIKRRDSMASAQGDFSGMTPRTRGSLSNTIAVAGPSGTNSTAPSSAGLKESPVSTPGTGSSAGGQQWGQAGYMPSLSPILSMSVSESYDESSSRGRPASRWWETESSGPSSTRLERSKRESKYMGVPREAWTAEHDVDSTKRPNTRHQHDSEYPPEKVSWHEQAAPSSASEASATTPRPLRLSATPSSIPSSSIPSSSSPLTPSAAAANNSIAGTTISSPYILDVSRLVTLPPPYPRHHPAVNNNHPALTSIRNKVRTLTDFAQLESTKSCFVTQSSQRRKEAQDAAQARKTTLRTNLQTEIAAGRMTYAEAASIEADSAAAETSAAKEVEKKDFDAFQREIVGPLNDVLTSRIAQATTLFDELRSRLFEENSSHSHPDIPQEEGDEMPELVEKLTLLKWIFEARESLHRQIYGLLSDRNGRYRDMILTPYRLTGNTEKLGNAEAFFAQDARDRALASAEECLRRAQQFRDVVEENVVRGVEVQLSAFWDIAPPLKNLLDQIPLDLFSAGSAAGEGREVSWGVQIPATEYDENPSYHAHPLQYLYSLLLHAEKSTYQFIEAQTNLLCLLHEVKGVVAAAKAKTMEADGRDPQRVAEMKADDEKRLDEDLKEKASAVQDQWGDALGAAFVAIKARVGEFLLSTEGWDESLEDRGVGGA